MSLTDVERAICKVVVRQLLDQSEVTRRQVLLKEFKGSLPAAVRNLVDRSVLRALEQTHGNETYLPRAIAFHYCGDPTALAFAQKSTETVLRILLVLYEQELDKEPQNQRQFTPADVEAEARELKFYVDEKMIRIGLYFTDELSVLSPLQKDQKQVFPVSFRPSEKIYQVMKASNPWDVHIERGRVSVERDWDNRQSEAPPSGFSDKDIFDVRNSFMDSLQIHTDQEISRKIFLVHGHAEEPKQTVAAFLRSLGLEVVILHEQANQGRTIIEKFEEHSAVGFAVVLLTPDDVGASAGQPEKSHRRARQNVILELGFFIAKLGRKRVCPIYVEGVELPSDYHGVLYVPYDDGGAWRSKLVKELSAAGIEVHSENSSTMVPLMKRKLIV